MFAGVSSPAARTAFFARCRSVAALTAATLLTAASLAACSGGSNDEATATVTTPTPAATTPSPTWSPTPSPTPTGEPFELEDIPVPPEPMIPQEMLQYNQAGAQAFVMYALTELSWMFATNEVDSWRWLHDAKCEYCVAQSEDQLSSNNRTTGLNPMYVGWEFYQEPDVSDVWLVGVHYRVTKHTLWDLDAMLAHSIPASDEPASLYFVVGFDKEGWIIWDVLNVRPTQLLGEEKP